MFLYLLFVLFSAMYMKGEHQKWRPDCLRAAKLLLFVGPPPGLMDAPLYFFCFYISSIMMIVMMTMISPKIVMMMLIVKAMIRSTMMVFSPPRPHQGWLRHFAICCTVCNLSSPEKTQMGTFPVFFGLFCWCYLRFSAFFMCNLLHSHL